jgi:outer membrane immunogenic protein
LESDMTSRVLFGALALAGAVAFASGAQAADLRTPPPAMPAAAPVAYAPQIYNWSGFYIGGHLGGGYGESSWSDPFGGGNNNFNDWGFLGGAQVGANAQFNRLVLGLEGDFAAGPTSTTKAQTRSVTGSTPMCNGPRPSPAGSVRRSTGSWSTAKAVWRWPKIRAR